MKKKMLISLGEDAYVSNERCLCSYQEESIFLRSHKYLIFSHLAELRIRQPCLRNHTVAYEQVAFRASPTPSA